MSVAIVTGGARGIGRAIAAALKNRGDVVYATDIVPAEQGAELVPDGVQYACVDSSDHEQVNAFMQNVIAEHGQIDTMVNNAGITKDGLALRQLPIQWQQVMAVNLNGTFWFCQAALKQMTRQRNGCIINMSSVVATTGNPGQVNYAASKAGVEALTKTLAHEYGKRGVRVNAIAPGFIKTPMTQALSEQVQEAAVARTALGRAGLPDDIANLVCFLASPLSAYITGQIIHINGGMW